MARASVEFIRTDGRRTSVHLDGAILASMPVEIKNLRAWVHMAVLKFWMHHHPKQAILMEPWAMVEQLKDETGATGSAVVRCAVAWMAGRTAKADEYERVRRYHDAA